MDTSEKRCKAVRQEITQKEGLRALANRCRLFMHRLGYTERHHQLDIVAILDGLLTNKEASKKAFRAQRKRRKEKVS